MTKKKQIAGTLKSQRPAPKTKEPAKASKLATAPKTATIRRLLAGTTGASIDELAVATGWQVHSLRGFMSGTLKKKLGLEVTSTVHDGCRRYHIVEAVASK